MIDRSNLDVLTGTTAYDTDGKKIGAVGQVYLDAATGEPAWLAVRTGLFGTGESFVPAADATLEGDDVRIGHSKDVVKDAPRVDADGELAPRDVDALYSYYRLEEQLRVGTEQVETGKARLRKYVVTEQETVTVPVSHEEVRVVSEPITEDDTGDDDLGADGTSHRA